MGRAFLAAETTIYNGLRRSLYALLQLIHNLELPRPFEKYFDTTSLVLHLMF